LDRDGLRPAFGLRARFVERARGRRREANGALVRKDDALLREALAGFLPLAVEAHRIAVVLRRWVRVREHDHATKILTRRDLLDRDVALQLVYAGARIRRRRPRRRVQVYAQPSGCSHGRHATAIRRIGFICTIAHHASALDPGRVLVRDRGGDRAGFGRREADEVGVIRDAARARFFAWTRVVVDAIGHLRATDADVLVRIARLTWPHHLLDRIQLHAMLMPMLSLMMMMMPLLLTQSARGEARYVRRQTQHDN